MALTPAEWATVGGFVGASITVLVGYGVMWGKQKTMLNYVANTTKELVSSVELHNMSKELHLDAARDNKYNEQLSRQIFDGFTRLNAVVEIINMRCEKRGDACVGHFSHIEKKLAVMTGKVNGE